MVRLAIRIRFSVNCWLVVIQTYAFVLLSAFSVTQDIF